MLNSITNLFSRTVITSIAKKTLSLAFSAVVFTVVSDRVRQWIRPESNNQR